MKLIEKSVKIIPENNVRNSVLGEFDSLEDNILKVGIAADNDFETYQLFEVIVEEQNSLTVLKANLMKKDNDLYTFAFDEEPKKIFKREYERFDVTLALKGEKGVCGKTINLSAGGMQFVSKKSLKVNKMYKLSFFLGEKEISVEYETLRVQLQDNSHVVSGRFVAIDSADKAAIIQHSLKKKLDIRYTANQ